ncbi:MAG: hypothetical protein J0I81_04235 [Hyphomicrobium sp.]|nr:hypothetical protein [Hyphomicrobium sp.]
MEEYVSEFLLVLSVIGAPIILGALLFYGMTLSERRHSKHTENSADRATKRVYAQEERLRRDKEQEAARSSRALDSLKRRTGMTG